MGPVVVFVTIVAILLFFILIWFVKRYKRCPSDKILVVYGKVGRNKEGGGRTAKCIHGGAAFVWPIIQDYDYLDLTPIPINVDLRNALSKQNIRVNVPSRFMIGISTEPGIMDNAAERLLGLSLESIHDLAADIIFGQLRVVIATMDIEEINSDREKFLANVSEAVEHELKKIGLKLINVNITDITDENGYIEALGKEATAQAVNDAKKSVAEKDRDGAIGEANARQEQRVSVAQAMAQAEIGEAEAEQLKRIKISQANAEAVEGENRAKISIAQSDAERRKAEAEARKIAVIAEKTNEAEANKVAYESEKIAEMARAEREKATQYANIIIPAEVDKQKVEIQAEAEAERIRRIAKGEADSKFFEMDAQARGLYEIMSKQAEGFKAIVKSAGDNAKDAVMLMVADKLPDIVNAQAEAVKNIKIDKITVWDNLNGGEKGSSTANFVSSMLGTLPPFEDIFKMAGMELPNYLKGKKIEGVDELKENIKTEKEENKKED